MSAANACRRVSSVIALPPYLTTTILPCSALSHGSAAASTSALTRRSTAAVMSCTPSSLRRSRETGRWCGSTARCVTDAEVDRHVDVGAGQVDLAGAGRTHPVDAHRRTVERHTDPIRVEGDRRHADGGQHPPPVRVGAEQRGLDQAVAGHGAGGGERVGLGGRAGHGDDDAFGDALGVGLQLSTQVVAHPQHRIVEIALAGLYFAGTGGQQQHGVVGRAAAVDVEPVEGQRGRAAQRMVERGGVGDGVGGDHAQHGGQRRREHARALGHAADRPVVVVMQRNLFGHGVGGHDGAGGLLAAGQPAGHLVHDLLHAGQYLVHRQPVPDQPGRADRDLDRLRFRCPSRSARRPRPRRWCGCPEIRRVRCRRWRRRSSGSPRAAVRWSAPAASTAPGRP